jgi:hypothetical protein
MHELMNLLGDWRRNTKSKLATVRQRMNHAAKGQVHGPLKPAINDEGVFGVQCGRYFCEIGQPPNL